jgi:DNA processing protein
VGIDTLTVWPLALRAMRKAPKELYFLGDPALLERPMVSIVGTRRPNAYARQMTTRLAHGLAQRGVVVVSGAAMGIDAVAHRGAGAAHTIAVMPCGLTHRYPAVNAAMIGEIAEKGLLLSPYDPTAKAAPWRFVARNEIVVSLGSALVIAQADENSGSMRSAEYALKMGKPIYVLPHRIGESEGTNGLLARSQAEAIYDIEAWLDMMAPQPESAQTATDPIAAFCEAGVSVESFVARFGGATLSEAELEGRVRVEGGRVVAL